ncbi:protein of unknown function (plasmid) [Azospirillum baldaniorum]|uniref:Uncharacterized protein n=1 Tax=Azospirillum baldaniorum TaxID=1064539 RepID=A0A9P1NNW0_9PROT|nr:protein of unknown function [Azospirillum baldaniorum]
MWHVPRRRIMREQSEREIRLMKARFTDLSVQAFSHFFQ